MTIHPINALSDNYIWVIEENDEAIVVDPGEAEGVLKLLEDKQLYLNAIILTHGHEDHTAGVNRILACFPETPVYGPEETADLNTETLKGEDTVELLGQDFDVFVTAGHTHGHISLLMNNDALFCGDALFSGGCGRVFTQDYQAQFAAIEKFKELDDDVKVYAGHEYTEKNLNFAHTIEPDNAVISEALEKVERLRKEGRPTLPSTIGREKDINLFLQAETLKAFKELRQARDDF
ncbi:hydroxyacylglutathione hydrolase [Alkalibacterium subtropicum]|uniref:Hydroxyacylglutathione hydrolase n=1 Tax=Alkalibacterium subtropicum TaxID=753702 RepID=A0A1I1JMG5_9LACT|nr:hydroxyacylglutathione hydrolase [Alkalibacterium subtropicum]SFC49361.1 hydroxyacylglutathione hydrolase [Alkalibacterium subtropicum]